MWLAWILSIDQNINPEYHNQDVKLLCKKLVDVAVTTDKYVEKTKKHDLVSTWPYPVQKPVFYLSLSLIFLQW